MSHAEQLIKIYQVFSSSTAQQKSLEIQGELVRDLADAMEQNSRHAWLSFTRNTIARNLANLLELDDIGFARALFGKAPEIPGLRGSLAVTAECADAGDEMPPESSQEVVRVVPGYRTADGGFVPLTGVSGLKIEISTFAVE